MSVVVTPAPESPAASALDVVATADDPEECVDTWRDVAADAVILDGVPDSMLGDIRDVPGGETVPLVYVTTVDQTDAPADALVAPDDDAATVAAAIENAQVARDYRLAVTELYRACQGRDVGQPEPDIRDLREAADAAYEQLDGVPPSVFYAGTGRPLR